MAGLATAARWQIEILLGGLMAIVLYKILTGGIELSGLLMSKDQQGNLSVSPGRVQMLMATLLTALYYLIQVMETSRTDTLPPLPGTLVGLVGASHAIYLGGKARSLLFDKHRSKV